MSAGMSIGMAIDVAVSICGFVMAAKPAGSVYLVRHVYARIAPEKP